MARITVEDCLNNESNRFSLVRLASRRAKQLLAGSNPVTDTRGNRAIVSALREIASGKVRFLPEEEAAVPLLAVETSSVVETKNAVDANTSVETNSSSNQEGTQASVQDTSSSASTGTDSDVN